MYVFPGEVQTGFGFRHKKCYIYSRYIPTMRTLPNTTDRYGELSVTPIGHGSLYLDYKSERIAVDPYSEVADFSTLPEATVILITHDHYDHYDPEAIRPIATPETTFIAPPQVAELLRKDGFEQPIITLANGDIERAPGQPFHPKGEGNGYILTIDGKRIYIAGDTEVIPEMREINFIFIAFLPMMLPYTINEEELIQAAKIIEPEFLYPYHYTSVNKQELQQALPNITIR